MMHLCKNTFASVKLLKDTVVNTYGYDGNYRAEACWTKLISIGSANTNRELIQDMIFQLPGSRENNVIEALYQDKLNAIPALQIIRISWKEEGKGKERRFYMDRGKRLLHREKNVRKEEFKYLEPYLLDYDYSRQYFELMKKNGYKEAIDQSGFVDRQIEDVLSPVHMNLFKICVIGTLAVCNCYKQQIGGIGLSCILNYVRDHLNAWIDSWISLRELELSHQNDRNAF